MSTINPVTPLRTHLRDLHCKADAIIPRHRNRRRGVYAIQLLLALPLVLILFLAVIEFGFILLVEQTVTAASQQGARAAAGGGNMVQVLAAVNEVLALHDIIIAAATTDANVVIEQSGSPTITVSGFACTPVGPALPVAPIEHRVTVCLSLKPTGATSAWQSGALPDLLYNWGFALMSRVYTSSALAPTE